jgi:hypothetical protein
VEKIDAQFHSPTLLSRHLFPALTFYSTDHSRIDPLPGCRDRYERDKISSLENAIFCCVLKLSLCGYTQLVQIPIRIDEINGSYSRDTNSRPVIWDGEIDSGLVGVVDAWIGWIEVSASIPEERAWTGRNLMLENEGARQELGKQHRGNWWYFGNISCVNLDAVRAPLPLVSVFVPFESHGFLAIPRWPQSGVWSSYYLASAWGISVRIRWSSLQELGDWDRRNMVELWWRVNSTVLELVFTPPPPVWRSEVEWELSLRYSTTIAPYSCSSKAAQTASVHGTGIYRGQHNKEDWM